MENPGEIPQIRCKSAGVDSEVGALIGNNLLWLLNKQSQREVLGEGTAKRKWFMKEVKGSSHRNNKLGLLCCV